MPHVSDAKLRRCLRAVRQGPCTASELSYRLGDTIKCADRLARRLEAQGLVRVESVRTDHGASGTIYHAIEETAE